MSSSTYSDQSEGWHPSLPGRAAKLLLLFALAVGIPARAAATESESRLGLDLRLRPPAAMSVARGSHHGTAPAAEAPAAVPAPAATAPATTAASESGQPDLGFDLLGPQDTGPKPAVVDEERVKLRRKMLTYHPLLGLGLLVCETATIVVGQLNYSDRFGGGPSSGRYERAHLLLAGGTALLFVGTGLLALLAPNPLDKPHQGFDRVLLHKLAMLTATAGMVSEIVLGIYTTRREGYLNQASFARVHLAIGYATLAATYVGVGSIVF